MCVQFFKLFLFLTFTKLEQIFLTVLGLFFSYFLCCCFFFFPFFYVCKYHYYSGLYIIAKGISSKNRKSNTAKVVNFTIAFDLCVTFRMLR